jgi:hypothetical protein
MREATRRSQSSTTAGRSEVPCRATESAWQQNKLSKSLMGEQTTILDTFSVPLPSRKQSGFGGLSEDPSIRRVRE